MKFYLFYLKSSKRLYAFTDNKKYANTFLNQRNSKCFIVKSIKLDGEKEKIFLYNNRLLKLNEYPYQTGTGVSEYVSLIATAEEDDKITSTIEEFEKSIEEINRLIKKYPIKNKYRKSLERLVTIYDDESNILVDTFSLFIDLFKDTFIKKHQNSKY